MKFVKMDPPGTFCFYDAVIDCIRKNVPGKDLKFLEVGCGAGDLSQILCEQGYRGVGIDFSPQAISLATENLAEHINDKNYRLVQANVMDKSSEEALDHEVDMALSMMVMEHVEDDQEFIRNIAKHVKPGGHILLAVPGRKDRWSFEDETAGHLRRYDKSDLEDTMKDAGLESVTVWSVAIPISNLLFRLSDFVMRASDEKDKVSLSQREQTQTSGVREIPFKTVFPPICRIILNRYSLFPLFLLQRLFYKTGLGLIMLGVGRMVSR